MLRIHLVPKKSIRLVTDILFRTFSSRVLSLSRCSPEIHQILYNLIHYTFVFHLSPVAMMPEFNGNKKKNANDNGSGQVMPAEFDLPTAIFVVVAGMVGAGVLTTSGYTVLAVGSNQWMLILWVVGDHGGLWGFDACRVVRGSSQDGGRLRLPLRSLRAFAGLFIGLGVVSDRVCRSKRGGGICFRSIHRGRV